VGVYRGMGLYSIDGFCFLSVTLFWMLRSICGSVPALPGLYHPLAVHGRAQMQMRLPARRSCQDETPAQRTTWI